MHVHVWSPLRHALGAAVAICVLATCPSTVHAATGFLDPDLLDTVASSDVIAEDLDGDGHDDLVSVGGGELVVHLSDGEGGFAASSYPTAPGDDAWLAVGDIDGDGHLDALVSPRVLPSVLVLHGDGAGGFGPAVQVATKVGYAGEVAIGSFGGDTEKDIAVLDRTGGIVQTFVQNDDGSFSAGPSANPGDGYPNALAAVDLNNDGRTDLVTANGESDDISILLQGEDGFADPVRRAVGDNPSDIIAADVVGGPDIDLVTADSWSGSVSVFPATAPAVFGERVVHGVGTEIGPLAIAADDLDADGDEDIVGSTFSNSGVVALLGGPGGTFESVEAGHLFAAAPRGVLAMGQFDGDGELDLAVPTWDEAVISILFGTALHLDWQWIDWGMRTAGTVVNQTITLRNTGSHALNAGAVGFLGDHGPFTADVSACAGRTLAVREPCAIVVGFKPPDGPQADFQALLEVPGDGTVIPSYALLEGTSWPASQFVPQLPPQVTRPRRLPLRRSVSPQPPPSRGYGSIKGDLAKLANAVPKLIRGGPRGERLLPRFAAPVAGRLSLTLFGWSKKGRMKIGGGSLRLQGWSSDHLGFRLSKKGRALLRRPRRTRVKAVLTFVPGGASFRQAHEFIVKAPSKKRR